MNKGRHTKPDAIVRIGKRFLLWLSPEDLEKLERVTVVFKSSKADAVRKLIREFHQEEI